MKLPGYQWTRKNGLPFLQVGLAVSKNHLCFGVLWTSLGKCFCLDFYFLPGIYFYVMVFGKLLKEDGGK